MMALCGIAKHSKWYLLVQHSLLYLSIHIISSLVLIRVCCVYSCVKAVTNNAAHEFCRVEFEPKLAKRQSNNH